MTVVHVRTWSLAILIAALAMLGPFSIDAYLPAFHAIGREFAVPQIAVQQTLSVYLFAYAFMMLWHGALADALGRRPVVLASLAIYALATLGCAIAGNIETLWLFRALQGLCAGAGIVVGRAIIRDRFHGAEAQRLMSQITLVFGVAPAIAPVLGGVLLNVFGWRAVFWLLLVLVIALLTWASKRLPETLARSARQSLLPRHLWRNYVNVLRRPEFLLLAAIPALNFAAFFLYIAVAPSFLMDLLGVSSYGFAWLFIPMITGVMVGALISGRTAGLMTPRRTIGLGYILMFVGVATDLSVATLVPPGVPWHVLPIMIYAIGSSVTMPSATLLLLDLFPAMRGLASSLQGFLQFVLAAVNAGTIAPLLAGSLLSLALGMAGFTVLSLLLWITYLRHTR
ncbi:MAG TPA: multidrug effflux MFS transporter [Casimicrobiaceae bacterium]|jgi:DHA1 family bicyclomycin/chloramphenicol resistance-like MFS transporter|nr:multidrug effflux MFS transporter [Casimicrobiaceae bacterium]